MTNDLIIWLTLGGMALCLMAAALGVVATLATALVVADIAQRSRVNTVSPLSAHVLKKTRAVPKDDPLGADSAFGRYEEPNLDPAFRQAAARAADSAFGGAAEGILDS